MRLLSLTRNTRWLMIMIAIVGLLAGGVRLWMRRMEFLEIAEAHASRVYDYGENRVAICWKDEFLEVDTTGRTRPKKEFAKHLDACTDHFAELERKYRYAASHPWLQMQPDPPSPPLPTNLTQRSSPER